MGLPVQFWLTNIDLCDEFSSFLLSTSLAPLSLQLSLLFLAS